MEATLLNTAKAPGTWRSRLFSLAVYAYTALWGYAAFIKLSDAERAMIEMKRQVFPPEWGEWIFYLIPCVEILLVMFLMHPAGKIKALATSLALMSVFSLYTLLILLGAFGSIPCFTGGVYVDWSHRQHLVFNLLFMALAASALVLTCKGRKRTRTGTPGRKEVAGKSG